MMNWIRVEEFRVCRSGYNDLLWNFDEIRKGLWVSRRRGVVKRGLDWMVNLLVECMGLKDYWG